MFFDFEITEDLVSVPISPPPITRQYACLKLSELTSSNYYERSNSELSFDTIVNPDELIFRSMPNLDTVNTINTNNTINTINTINLPRLKRYNSESKQFTSSPILKKIKTF